VTSTPIKTIHQKLSQRGNGTVSFLCFNIALFSSLFSANFTFTKIKFHFIIASLKSAKELTIKMSDRKDLFDLKKLVGANERHFMYLFNSWASCMTNSTWLDKLFNMGE